MQDMILAVSAMRYRSLGQDCTRFSNAGHDPGSFSHVGQVFRGELRLRLVSWPVRVQAKRQVNSFFSLFNWCVAKNSTSIPFVSCPCTWRSVQCCSVLPKETLQWSWLVCWEGFLFFLLFFFFFFFSDNMSAFNWNIQNVSR